MKKIKATVTYENRFGKIVERSGYGDTQEEALKFASCKEYANITVEYDVVDFDDDVEERSEDELQAEQKAWEALNYGR